MNINKRQPATLRFGLLAFLSTLLLQIPVYGHVKWFSDYAFSDRPLTLPEVLNPAFFVFTLLCVVAIGLCTAVAPQITALSWFKQAVSVFSRFQNKSVLIIRVAAAAVLLLSWQANTLLMPDLVLTSAWIGWVEFVLFLLLIFPRTVRLAGVGLILLYGIGLMQFGFFHMFDHALFLGVGIFLARKQTASGEAHAGFTVLFASLGFTICWLALEKIFYPTWTLDILAENPQLALGLDPNFFLISTAFVEFSLGFMLIIGLFRRPLAVLLPSIFALTTLVFGKTEVIGHAMIYAILMVVLVQAQKNQGTDRSSTDDRLGFRLRRTIGYFSMLLVILLVVYADGAQKQYMNYIESTAAEIQHVESVSGDEAPHLQLTVHRDHMAGWNLELQTENFQFSPDACGGGHTPGSGHAHLYVNGKKTARLYSNWYHLSGLEAGSHTITITLVTNDHRLYALDGEPIVAEYDLVIPS